MNLRNKIVILLILITTIVVLAACDMTAEEAKATVQSLGPIEIAGIAATIESLSPQEVANLEQLAVNAGVPPLSQSERNAVIATVDAARAQATAVMQQIASGERVNATAAPSLAPIIRYFFASAPNQAQAADGIRYFLNWTTEDANRVEIFGQVMDNPVEGSWPVYNESNHWVLWAANDQTWVESVLDVTADWDTGAVLQSIATNSRSVMVSMRDPQFVDGDQIAIDVNGVRVINNYVLSGRQVSFPISLNPGINNITLEAQSAGVTYPMVAELTFSNVTIGPVIQQTRGMNSGERATFTITAP
ncbi:MAG: hypothetical protein ACK2T3_14190 [Candidatus Promineifilaceae bacterium]